MIDRRTALACAALIALMLALAAWRAADVAAAKHWIEMINTDPGTPPDERNRMEMLSALMASEGKS